jgi:Bax protein
MKKDFKSKLKTALSVVTFLFIVFLIGTFLPNPYTKHLIKKDIESYYTNWANQLGLQEPSFNYNNDVQFVQAVRKCVDWVNFETPRFERVPMEMIVGQAALESGWGTSRFALEGNNLFGIRTYDKDVPHMLISGAKKWPGWGVRVFTTKCQSVQFFVELLNNHSAYEEFRDERYKMLILGQQLDAKVLIKTLKAYSTTTDYAERVNFIVDKIREQEQKVGEVKIDTKSDSKVVKNIIPASKPKDLTK